MANKWTITPTTDLQVLYDRSLYNVVVDVFPDKLALPVNYQHNDIWEDSTLVIPDENGDPIAATDVPLEQRPVLYYSFILSKTFRDFANGLKVGIYNWQGDAIQLLSQYIKTNRTNISVQDALPVLVSGVEIELDDTSKKSILTVPEGKTAIIVDVITRYVSGIDIGYTNNSFGGDGTASDWIAGESFATISGGLLISRASSTVSYGEGTTFGMIANSVPVSPSNDLIVKVDLFGYFLNE